MFTNNKFAKMDSIANLINTILETDTKAKMEELKGNQHKIDKNHNNKIDAQDFKILRGQKKGMKEESEQVEEGQSHQAKTTMKHITNPTAGEKKAAKDIKPGVAGYRDRIAMLKSAEARGALKKEEAEQVDEARVKGKGYDNPENERKAPEGHVSMTSLMPGHDERAAKFLARQAKGTLVKGKAQSAPQKEEIDPKNTITDTLKGREKTSKDPFLSKKVMMDVPGNVKEEAEQVDEASYSAKAARAGKDIGKPGKMFSKIAKGAAERYGSKERGEKVAGAVLKKLRSEEVEQVDERAMTKPETAEKERIVKGMKKNLAGFKQRYGERAKNVMYATATKQAMKSEEVDEKKKVNEAEDKFLGAGLKRAVKGAEFRKELGHEDRPTRRSSRSYGRTDVYGNKIEEPHSVHINGKKWKTFGSFSHANNVAKKIKGATVHYEG